VEYKLEKATPEESKQIVVTYLKEAEAVDGSTVLIVDRRETTTVEDIKLQVAGADDQIAVCQAKKAELEKLIAEAEVL
jgi:hypothetical protein